MPKFHTTRGQLTAYALACGYVEKRKDVTLWREHGVYHVRKFNESGRTWLAVHTLKQARKLFANIR